MKYRHFEDLLAEFQRCDAPPLPISFPADVLREIRLRSASQQAACEVGWLPSLRALLFRPSLLPASLSVAIAVGALMPGFVIPASQPPPMSGSDWNVFSTASPYFPSGLLANPR